MSRRFICFCDTFLCAGGGVGSTVPVEGGVVSSLYGFCQCILSLNACVFLSIH